jgi:cation:H+ antiporter
MAVWQPAAEEDRLRAARRPSARPRRRPSAPPQPVAAPAAAGTVGGSLSALPMWQARLALMAACTLPGILARVGGAHVPPPLGMALFGGAVMAAAFMLGSAAEAAEIDAPPGIAVAGVALVAVLPEYVIEIYFAFTGHVEFVTASLTGSTRLLLSVAVGMPALVLLLRGARGRTRLPTVELAPDKRVDLAIIAAASLYAPVIVLRGHLAWPDAIVLIGLYAVYLHRVSTGEPEPPHLVGIAAELGELSRRQRRRWVLGIMAFSAVAVLITAEPFAQSTLMTGQTVGLSPYLLVQWLVPLATETPELVVAYLLVRHDRPGQAVAVLLSSAVSQWTLALGTLPVAYVVGAGQGSLALLHRESIEMLLTTGQGLLAVAALVTLRIQQRDAVLMVGLFVVQVVLPSTLVRAALGVVYLVLAIGMLRDERWAARSLLAALSSRPPPRP